MPVLPVFKYNVIFTSSLFCKILHALQNIFNALFHCFFNMHIEDILTYQQLALSKLFAAYLKQTNNIFQVCKTNYIPPNTN